MDTFTWIPSFGADKTVKPEVKVVKFTEGYEKRFGSYNNVNEEWSLSFDTRNKTETASIESFLVGKGGYQAFLWVNPNTTTITVVC